MRLRNLYFEEIIPKLKKQFNIKNDFAVPRLSKIVVSMGLGRFSKDEKAIQAAIKDLTNLTGQHAVITKAKKSVSAFSIRQGAVSGAMVTLRKDMMYGFLDRFIHISLPVCRGFKGFSVSAMDGRGNMNMGITEHTVFHEIDYANIHNVFGLNISCHISGDDDLQSAFLLHYFGIPFRNLELE